MSKTDVPEKFEKFEKRTSSFYISVKRTRIDIEIFGESITTKVIIYGEAKIYGGFNEWIEIGDWILKDSTLEVLELINEDVSIKLNLSLDEIDKIFNIIIKDYSLGGC